MCSHKYDYQQITIVNYTVISRSRGLPFNNIAISKKDYYQFK